MVASVAPRSRFFKRASSLNLHRVFDGPSDERADHSVGDTCRALKTDYVTAKRHANHQSRDQAEPEIYELNRRLED